MGKVTVGEIIGMKAEGRRIAVLTAYGYQTACILDEAGIPVILVGDSAGMVEAGYGTTLPVSMDEMIYHVASVRRGVKRALIAADMPFMSYQASVDDAVRNAGRFIKEGGAEAVKVEGGGERTCAVITAIVEAGIPVMGHVGLKPQSVNAMGGYKVQGRDGAGAQRIIEEARAVEKAGAFSIVVEGVPAALGEKVTRALSVPTIGIGAGAGCDGQVLVLNDMLGMDAGGKSPRFVKRYAEVGEAVRKAVIEYKEDVEGGRFPSKEHSYE